MPYVKYTRAEVASQGEPIYGQQLGGKVEPEYYGSFLVIDIETAAYEIDADDVVATKRILASYPNAVIYSLRIGSPTAYRIGGRFFVKAQRFPGKSQRMKKLLLEWDFLAQFKKIRESGRWIVYREQDAEGAGDPQEDPGHEA